MNTLLLNAGSSSLTCTLMEAVSGRILVISTREDVMMLQEVVRVLDGDVQSYGERECAVIRGTSDSIPATG